MVQIHFFFLQMTFCLIFCSILFILQTNTMATHHVAAIYLPGILTASESRPVPSHTTHSVLSRLCHSDVVSRAS